MRIGIDIGGTKIAAALFDGQGRERARCRAETPRDDAGLRAAIARLVGELRHHTARGEGGAPSIGLCLPGLVDSVAGTVAAVNLPWLKDRPFAADLAATLGRPVRLANDANCFALSEAVDGAGADGRVVFGAILGTGVGGGIVVDRRLLAGANGLAGEWGHLPLPWRREADDGPPAPCPCGRRGCVETHLSGAGLVRLYALHGGQADGAREIAARRIAGEALALATFARFADAAARALSGVIGVLDPEVVVIGGGLSALPGLCEGIAARLPAYALAPGLRTAIRPAHHGDDSGVRGAAWLWPDQGDGRE